MFVNTNLLNLKNKFYFLYNKYMMNIVLAINDQYVSQASALIMSIYKNARKDASIKINIIHSSVTQQHQDIMKDMVKDMENISELNFVDMKQFVSNKTLDEFMPGGNSAYRNPEVYYRLFIPTVFHEYDKVLYLDSDLIVCDDLTELYNTDIKDFYACAVHEPKYFFRSVLVLNNKRIKIEDYLVNKLNITDKSYFNSGVMLLNLDEMRKNNIQEKSLAFLSEKYPFAFCDQCVLNSILHGKVKFLDKKYNIFYSIFPTNNKPSVLHYTGAQKPWNYYKKNEGFELYWKYFKLTPFYNEEQENLYLKFKSKYLKKKFIKIVLGKKYYRVKMFGHHFKISPKIVDFYRKAKEKLSSLLCKTK